MIFLPKTKRDFFVYSHLMSFWPVNLMSYIVLRYYYYKILKLTNREKKIAKNCFKCKIDFTICWYVIYCLDVFKNRQIHRGRGGGGGVTEQDSLKAVFFTCETKWDKMRIKIWLIIGLHISSPDQTKKTKSYIVYVEFFQANNQKGIYLHRQNMTWNYESL